MFQINELINADGFSYLEDQAINRCNELVDEISHGSKIKKRKMVEIFDELSDTLCKVADMAEFIRIAHPDKDYAQYAENACISISGIVEKYVLYFLNKYNNKSNFKLFNLLLSLD